MLLGQTHTVTLLLGLGVIALIGFFSIWRSGTDVPEAVENDSHLTRSDKKSSSIGDRKRRPDLGVEDDSLDLALEELRARWEEYFDLKKSGEDKRKLHKLKIALAYDSALQLQASEQMIQLLMFLEGMNALSEANTVRWRIATILETADPDSVVDPLVNLISERFSSLGDHSKDVLEWCYLLGERGSDTAYERFLAGVEEKWCKGDFQYGWHKAKAKSNPVGAFTAVVDLMKSGSKGSRQDQALQRVVENFPEGEKIDYEMLESYLPGQGDEAYDKARSTILTSWAEAAPADAVNYAIEHPERVPLRDVTYIVAQAIKDLGFDGIEWVNGFPEGPYYDRAAVAVVQRLWFSDLEVATRWANSIGDEALRRDQLRNIETMRERSRRREK